MSTPIASFDMPHPRTIDPAAARWLVMSVLAALIGAAIVIALVLTLVQRRDFWAGYLGASVISVLSALASLPPLLFGLRRDLMKAVAGAFVAAALRAIVSLGGCILIVKLLDYPAAPTLLIMVGYYVAVLVAESGVVARAVWNVRA